MRNAVGQARVQTQEPVALDGTNAQVCMPVDEAPAECAGRPVSPDETPRSLPRGPIAWQLLVLATPMLGEQFLSFLVGLVDTWLAGQISKEATLAVGTGSYLGWFVNLAFSFVGVGAAALVSRAMGAGDTETANRGLNQSIWISMVVGAVVTVVSLAAAPALSAFLTQSAAAESLCTLYVRIIALSYLLASLNMVGGAVLRAAGDTVSPMRVMAVVNVVNVIVSAGLVFGWFGPQIGVAGVAVGTLVARSVGGLLMLGLLCRGIRGLRVSPGLLRPDRVIVGRIVRVGLPASADSAMMTIAQLAFIKIIAHTASGDAATVNYAAHVIAMQVEAISYLPAFALGTAAATLVGQYLGAGQPAKATRSGHVAALQGGLLGVAVGLAFFVAAGAIYRLMSGDAEVQRVGTPAFRILALAQPFLCAGIIYINALRGAGDTRVTWIISAVCGVAIRVPVALLLGIVLGGGLIGAWCGMWADNVIRCGLALWRFAQGGWRQVRV